jgi:hypothetical protein
MTAPLRPVFAPTVMPIRQSNRHSCCR